jgi:hypothetical protein
LASNLARIAVSKKAFRIFSRTLLLNKPFKSRPLFSNLFIHFFRLVQGEIERRH